MTEDEQPPPAVTLAMDQVVAINVRYWRKAAGLTQAQLGERLGWSAAVVSAAERSVAENRDRRRFDAQELTELCIALGVPLSALFLPPPGDGEEASYQFTAGGRQYSMDELMEQVTMPDTVTDTVVMEDYRERFFRAGMHAADNPRQIALVIRWTSGVALRAQWAADLRQQSADLEAAAVTVHAAAAGYAQLADELENGKDSQ